MVSGMLELKAGKTNVKSRYAINWCRIFHIEMSISSISIKVSQKVKTDSGSKYLCLICFVVTKFRLGMRTRSKLRLGTSPPSSAPCLPAFTTRCINPWGQERKLKAKQSRNLCVSNNPMTQGTKQ